MGFPRQEYRSGLPFPSPGDLPNPGTEPSPPALAGRFFTHWSTRGTHTDEDTRAQFQTHWVWRGRWSPKQRWRLKPQICVYPPTQPPVHLPVFGEQLLTFQWLSSFTELSAGEDKRWRWKETKTASSQAIRPFILIINLSAGSIQGPSTKVL